MLTNKARMESSFHKAFKEIGERGFGGTEVRHSVPDGSSNKQI